MKVKVETDNGLGGKVYDCDAYDFLQGWFCMYRKSKLYLAIPAHRIIKVEVV